METSPCCNSVAGNQIATNFCTCQDSTAVVPCTKFCSDHCIRIEMRVKRNFHRIWIAMEKPLGKRGPGLRLTAITWCWNHITSGHLVARPSVNKILTMQEKQFLVIHQFPFPMPSRYWEMKCNFFSISGKGKLVIESTCLKNVLIYHTKSQHAFNNKQNLHTQLIAAWASFEYPIRRLIVRFHVVSKPRDW